MEGIWIGGMLIFGAICLLELFHNPAMAILGILVWIFLACAGRKE